MKIEVEFSDDRRLPSAGTPEYLRGQAATLPYSAEVYVNALADAIYKHYEALRPLKAGDDVLLDGCTFGGDRPWQLRAVDGKSAWIASSETSKGTGVALERLTRA